MAEARRPAPHGSPPPARLPSRLRPLLAAFALALLVGLAYGGSLDAPYLFDDGALVRDSPCVRDVGTALEGLVRGADHPCGYRPVRHVSYALDAVVAGSSPRVHRTTNLLLHLGVSLLVLLLGRRLGLDPIGAFAAAAVFAVHPIHTEAVTYLTGRKDLLVTLFALAAVLAAARWRRTGRNAALALAALFFLLALGSKETGVVVPLLAAGVAWAATSPGPGGRRDPGDPAAPESTTVVSGRGLPSRSGTIAVAAATLLVMVAYVAIRGIVSPVTVQTGPWGGDWGHHTATAAALQWHALGLQWWPAALLGDYSPDAFPLHDWTSPAAWAGAALLAATAAAAVRLRRRSPLGALLLGGYLLSVAPSAQILPHHELFAERNLYLASVFVCLGAGWLAATAAARIGRLGGARGRWALGAATLVAGLVLLGGLLRTVARNADYRSEEAYWAAVVERAPRCVRALSNLASIRLEQERWAEAAGLLDHAAAVRKDLGMADDPTIDGRLGVALLESGRPSAAAAALDRALGVLPGDSMALYHRTRAARAMDDAPTQAAVARRLVAALPDDPLGYRYLADALLRLDRVSEALETANDGLRRRPGDAVLLRLRTEADRGASGN
jgi:tetratricopeptide (TPR) repeat protein